MTPRYVYKFMYELAVDLERYLNMLRARGVHIFEVRSSHHIIGGEAEIETDASLEELIQIADDTCDCHYIYETINLLENYTGQRTYATREY